MTWAGAARGLSVTEKTRGKRRRELWRIFHSFAGRLPASTGVLAWRMEQTLSRPRTAGPWFGLSSPFAEAVAGQQLGISADPSAINTWLFSQVSAGGIVFHPRDYFLGGGEWSALTSPLALSNLDQEVRDLIACGGDVRAAPVFATLCAMLAQSQGTCFHNGVWFRSSLDIEAYLKSHAALIQSIKTHGVLRRADALKLGHRRVSPLEIRETDAGVAVSADGNLLRYRGGFHRVAIARELGLRSMPVAVRLVHADWLRLQMRETGLDAMPALFAGLKRLSAG